MRKSAAVLLLTITLVSPAFADGPNDFEASSQAPEQAGVTSDKPNHYVSRPDNGTFRKKPEVVLSTKGPVPVGTIPQAPIVPGSGNGLNATELNVLVAPQNGIFRNGSGSSGQGGTNNPPAPAPTTIVVP